MLPEAPLSVRLHRRLLFGEAGIMPALFVVLVLALVATQPYFATSANIVNVLRSASPGRSRRCRRSWPRSRPCRYIDLEQNTLQPIDNPFGTRMSPISPEQDVT